MNKQEFLTALEGALTGLPREDVSERLAFYGEMIDDRMEEGLSEAEAVAAVGDIDSIVSQTVEDTPLAKIVKHRMSTKRKMRVWEIVLIVLGAPLWLALIVAASAVLIAMYAVIFSLIITLWAVEASLFISGLGCIAAAVLLFFNGHGLGGVATLGVGLALVGVSILLFFVCVIASKGLFRLTRLMVRGIKSLFIGKEKS